MGKLGILPESAAGMSAMIQRYPSKRVQLAAHSSERMDCSSNQSVFGQLNYNTSHLLLHREEAGWLLALYVNEQSHNGEECCL